MLLPSTLFCSLPQLSHAGQLEKGDSVDQGHSLQVAKKAITKLVTIVVGKQAVNDSTFYNMNKMYTLFHFFIKFIHLTFERGSCMDQDKQRFQTHSQQSCLLPCSSDKFHYTSSDSGM